MNKNIIFSVFENGRAKEKKWDISLNELYKKIKESGKLEKVTLHIRELHARCKEAEARWDALCADETCEQSVKDTAKCEWGEWDKSVSNAKKELSMISVHAYFPEGRKDKDPHTFTNLILTDIDHITQEQVDELMPRIKTLPFVVLACRSVRGEGIHILSHVEVEGGINDDNFRNVFNATTHIVECTLDVEADMSVGSISRCMFLNHDAEAYYNPEATPLKVDSAMWLEKSDIKNFKLTDMKKNLAAYLDAADGNLDWRDGNRHSTLVSLASTLNKAGFDLHDVISECISRYTQSGFDAKEVESTIEDVYRRYQSDHGTNRESQQTKKDKVTKRQKAIVEKNMEDFVDEDKLLGTPCPDVDVLMKYIPQYFWDYTISKNSNKHTQFASVMALLVSGGAAFMNIRCQVRRGEKATGKLFFITSGPAASGKSCIKRPHELFLAYANAIENESEAEVAKQKEAHTKWKSCQNKCKEEDCGCGAEPVVPGRVRINLSLNISPSKLVHQQAHNKNIPCLLYTTEIDHNLDLKENPLSPVLREGYESETISSHTHAHGDVRVDEPSMALLAAGTPMQVVSLLGNKENGLASRVLIMYLPESDYIGLAEEDSVDYRESVKQKDAFIARAKTFCHYVANTDLTFDIDHINRALFSQAPN